MLRKLARALSAPHPVGRYAELLDPRGTRPGSGGVITDVLRETDDSVTLTIRPGRGWRGFAAGQYVNLGVVVDGVRHTRCFSPCDSEHRRDGQIQLTVKARADGLVSRELYDRARPGLAVTVSPAAGDFFLPEPRPRDVLLIGGGSGITPVLAMARTLADEQGWRTESAIRRVTLVHYIDSAADLVHGAELYRLAGLPGVSVAVVCGDGQPAAGVLGAHGLSGRFTADHLDRLAPWAIGSGAVAETFLCGPAPMMDAVHAVYAERGAADHLHTEAFTAPAFAVAPGDEATGTVTFAASAVTADNSGKTLLEQAEDAGLTPAYGCRMGICFTCTAVRRTGCTRDLVTGRIDGEPDQPIQLCVSAPVGDVDVDI